MVNDGKNLGQSPSVMRCSLRGRRVASAAVTLKRVTGCGGLIVSDTFTTRAENYPLKIK